MDTTYLDQVCKQVYAQFPEVNNVKPKVSPQGSENSLLIFQGTAKAANGRSIPRVVRAVISPGGQILKLTTSR